MPRSKYNARRTEYDGVVYDSKLEADFARLLDIARLADNPADRVVWMARQVRFYFPWGTYHRLDFVVGKADGSVCFIEVKGLDAPLGREKRRILEHYLGHQISVWRG